MLTNNYFTLRKMLHLGLTTYVSYCPEDFVVQAIGGTLYGAGQTYGLNLASVEYTNLLWAFTKAVCHTDYNNGYNVNGISVLTSRVGVYFGSDATPATPEDYKLLSPIESGLTIVNEDAGTLRFSKQADGSLLYIRSYMVTNTSTKNITIAEIGIMGICNTSSSYYPVLLERTVLDEAVTIAPNESKLVTYKVTIPPMTV